MISSIVSKVKLDIIPFRCAQIISRSVGHNIDASVRESWFCDSMIAEIRMHLAGKKYDDIVIIYPKDWIQSLKERFAPEWVLHQYPVIYKKHTISASRYFPDFKVEIPKERFGESVFWYTHNESEVKDDGKDSD